MLLVCLFVCKSKFYSRSVRVGEKVASAPSVQHVSQDPSSLQSSGGVLPAHHTRSTFPSMMQAVHLLMAAARCCAVVVVLLREEEGPATQAW